MSLLQRAQNLVTWQPLETGAPAPRLSLTADEGTWVRLPDFQGHINVVLLFFRSLSDDATDSWLKEFQRRRTQFEELETAIFGVSTARTDRLREFRTSLGLEYFLLYDPFAVDSRGFRASGRVRPFCKDTVVVIDKEGKVAWSQRGQADPAEVLAVVARLQGADIPEAVAGAEEEASSGGFTGIRNPGQRPDEVKNIESEAAVSMLEEKDSPYKLVDVRTLSEFEADHAPEAIHIPVDELPHRYQELGQTTHLIMLCQAGGRSAAAGQFLTSIGGSHIYNVTGGMSGWSGTRVTGGKIDG